jgi:hypothetical protein
MQTTDLQISPQMGRQTMTASEIAIITNKQKKHVMRDCRNLIESYKSLGMNDNGWCYDVEA